LALDYIITMLKITDDPKHPQNKIWIASENLITNFVGHPNICC